MIELSTLSERLSMRDNPFLNLALNGSMQCHSVAKLSHRKATDMGTNQTKTVQKGGAARAKTLFKSKICSWLDFQIAHLIPGALRFGRGIGQRAVQTKTWEPEEQRKCLKKGYALITRFCMLYSGFCRLVSENPVVETQPYFFQVLEVQGRYILILPCAKVLSHIGLPFRTFAT